jgi:two-component system, sensor histidine kinase LadS
MLSFSKIFPRAVTHLMLLWLLTALTLPAQFVHAHETVIDIQRHADHSQSLGRFLHLYYDASGQMTQAQIAALDTQDAMRHTTVAAPSLGYQSGATWVRFDLLNPGQTRQTRWLHINWAYQQNYDLYVTRANGETLLMRSGSNIPIEQRPLVSRYFLFPLDLAPGETVRAYLRASGQAAQILDLQLWRPAAFVDHMTWHMVWKYLAFGSTLIVLVFSVLSWQVHRRLGLLALAPAHLLLIMVYFGMDGFYADWVPASHSIWTNRLVNLWGNLSMFLHAQFARSFLTLDQRFPRLDRLFNRLIWTILVTSLALIALQAPMQLQQGGALIIFLLTLFAVRAAWGGDANARGYLLAWGFLFAGILMRAAQAYGWLSNISYVGNLLFLGLLTTVLVLTFILYRDVRASRQIAEAMRQKMQQQREDEQARLSQAVEERTAELHLALANVEQANRAKTIFLSSMSHELRTPLHTVLGFSALAKQKASDEIRLQIDSIERNGRHLLRLIDDLLNFSRDETAPMQLQLEPVRLASFVDHLRRQGQRMAIESGNRFRLECSPNLPDVVEMDEARLMQILLNLLSNACKYTEQGLVELHIEGDPDAAMETTSRRWRLWFKVADNGAGIDPADQERIFQPFVRLSDGTARPGMGLGLGIVRHWVHAMGGELHLDSVPGQGSRFSFSLLLRLTSTETVENPLLKTQQLENRQSLPAGLMTELNCLLDAGQLPVLRRRAQALMPEHPQCEHLLLKIQALCNRVDLPGLEQLLQQDK